MASSGKDKHKERKHSAHYPITKWPFLKNMPNFGSMVVFLTTCFEWL
jgi:hypothetical protein